MIPFHNSRSLLAPLIGLAAAAILTFACRFAPGQATPTPTEQGFLPLTAVAQVTPPPPERRPCPVPTDSPSPPSLDDPLQAASPIQTFLNQGGDASQLVDSAPTVAMARPDLDGDSWVDLAFTVEEPSTGGMMIPGTLLVYRCQGEEYRLVYTAPERVDASAPTIHSGSDLNQDGGDDLLVSRRTCGAHTCVAEVQVLMWEGGTLMNHMQGATDDLPSPAIEVRAGDEDQPARIAITATGINSVGAGPFRPVTRLWSWDRQTGRYQPTEERLHDPQFRVHALHDADRAAGEGDLAAAIRGYQRVVEGNGLQDWVDPERERAVLAGYARFRWMLMELRLGRRSEAQSVLAELQGSTDPQGPGGAYADLATVFWDEYQCTSDLSAACTAARQFAAAHSAEILDPLYFGYSNPTYAAEDLCRLGEG